MFLLHINIGDVTARWDECPGGWSSGHSRIELYAHPMLVSSATVHGSTTLIEVRENRPEGDWITVRIDAARRQVDIEAGPGGVAPLYVATDRRGLLVASWSITDVVRFARADGIAPRHVTRLLTRRHRYTHDTCFHGLRRLTASSSLTWTGTELHLRYPDPVPQPLPRTLRSNVDPVGAFADLMNSVVEPVTAHPGSERVAVEVSGGVDSANVAVATRHAGTPVWAGGLLFAGRVGEAQRERRGLLTDWLGLDDIAVHAMEHLPLSPSGPRGGLDRRPHDPDGDVYLEAFDALRVRLGEHGMRTVLTGYGGDEVMGLSPDERPGTNAALEPPAWLGEAGRDALSHLDTETSPVTAVALPTLVVFAARHPGYLHAGLWPIAPYAHPRVSWFGRSLPTTWRSKKRILRHRLAREGVPLSVAYPDVPETFTAVMRASMQQHARRLLGDLIEDSPLVDAGLVDRAEVIRLHQTISHGGPYPELLYDLLATDVGVRSMITAAATSGTTRGPSGEDPSWSTP